MTATQTTKVKSRPYNLRALPVTSHDKLDRLAYQLRMTKEAVVRQAIAVGAQFMMDSIMQRFIEDE